MNQELIIVAVAGSLAAGIAVAGSRASLGQLSQQPRNLLPSFALYSTKPNPGSTPIPTLPVVASNVLSLRAPGQHENPPPSPGLYLAKPYSGLVLVPKAVDSSFAVVPTLG